MKVVTLQQMEVLDKLLTSRELAQFFASRKSRWIGPMAVNAIEIDDDLWEEIYSAMTPLAKYIWNTREEIARIREVEKVLYAFLHNNLNSQNKVIEHYHNMCRIHQEFHYVSDTEFEAGLVAFFEVAEKLFGITRERADNLKAFL
jgi:hypothetical protein